MARRFLLLFSLSSVLASPAEAQRVRVDRPLGELETAVGIDPYDPTAHYNLALGYWSKNKYEAAEAELRRAVELDSRFSLAWLALAVLPFAQRAKLAEEILKNEVPEEWTERVTELISQYRRAFLIDPLTDPYILTAVKPADVLFHEFWYYGLTAGYRRQYDVAVEQVESLIAEFEKVEEGTAVVHVPLRTNDYRYLLAYFEEKRGNHVRAIELYREALVHDVGLYMAHVRLADIHEARGEWTQALEERRRAADANPDDPTLLTDLARTLAQMQRWDEARQVIHRAVAANPDDPRPWYFRGLLDLRVGDRTAAREAFREFLKRAPSRYVQQIRDAEARLEGLS